jgi:hypothetical protein
MAEEGKLKDDFKIEYAKSARSACKVSQRFPTL